MNTIDRDLLRGNVIETDDGSNNNNNNKNKNSSNANKIPFNQLNEDNDIRNLNDQLTPANKRRRQLNESKNNDANLDTVQTNKPAKVGSNENEESKQNRYENEIVLKLMSILY